MPDQQKVVPITRSCGHVQNANLAKINTFDRKKLISRFESQPCFRCADDPATTKKRAAFLAEKRAAEAREAADLEARFGLDPLAGHPKILPLGTHIRAVLVAAAWDELGLDDTEFADLVAAPASQIDSAGWWLDNRDVAIADLPQVMADAVTEAVGVGSENPY